MKRCISLLLIALLFLSAASALGEKREAQLTLFVYITGSDLESGGGAATRDITEMLRSGVDASQVNILLMTGGSKRWWGGFPNDQVCIYRAQGMRPELLDQTDMQSMGKPETLTRFLDYGYANYPAKQYALILWDHGGGPLEGVCYDEIFSLDSLSMRELGAALEASPFGAGNPLEWIGFDACLMSSVETAYICAPYAKYMIASQETEPGSGWQYSFLSGLEQGLDGAEVGRRIIDSYFEDADEGVQANLTLACLDLSKIGAIEDAMDELFGELDAIISPESFSMLSNSRRDAKNFGRSTTGSDYDLVDLYHLASQYALIAPEGSAALLSAVDDAVVYQRSGSKNCNGLSVYYPYYNKSRYQSVWEQTYRELGFSEGYTRYMEDYAGLWLGDALADWQGLRTVGLPPEEGVQELTLELTDDQLAHFASAELYILGEFGQDNAYYDLYHMSDISLDENILSANYEYQALYALDGDGNILTDALTYIQRGDTYLVRAALSHVDGEQGLFAWMDDEPVTVYLQCKLAPGSDELQVVGVIEIPDAAPLMYLSEEDVLLSGKQTLTLDPDDWPWIQFVRQPKLMRTLEDGSIAGYPDWPYSSEVNSNSLIAEYYSVDNRAPWTLKFCRQQNSGRSLWAQYVVTDTQGEQFASDLLPIENPNVVDQYTLNRKIVSEGGLDITLSSIEAVDVESANGARVRFGVTSMSLSTHDSDAGLILRMRVVNNTQDLIYMSMENIVLNQTATSYNIHMNDPLSEDLQALFSIPENSLPPLEDPHIHSIQFELVVVNSERDEILRIPVQLEVEINLGELGPRLSEAQTPLATTVVGDVTYDLLELTEQDDGMMVAGIRIDNRGDTALKQDWNWCNLTVNGNVMNYLWEGESYVVPPNCRLYTRGLFPCWADAVANNADGYHGFTSQDYTPQFSEPNDFAYWDIERIESLAILPYIDEKRVDFVLDAPVELSRPVQPHDEVTLFSAGGISASLRELRVVGGELRLYANLRNQTDSEVKLAVMELRLNGRRKVVRFEGDRWSSYDTCNLAPNLSSRAALEIQLDDDELASSLEEMRFDFGYLIDGNWHYISDVSIQPGTACLLEELKDAPLTASALVVQGGEALDPEFSTIDPATLFEAELKMPEDAGQYRATLSAKLTPEQAQNYQEGELVLALRDEDSYLIYYTQEGLTPDADGWLHADFDGLLVCVAGQDEPLVSYSVDSGEDALELRLRGVFLEASLLEAQDAAFDNIYVGIDRAENSAHILKVDMEREVNLQERFLDLLYVHKRRVPTYDDSGALKHVDDWDLGETTGYFCLLNDDGLAELVVRPASDFELCAIFCIRDADGNGYSLEPIPYADAIS